MMQYYSKEKWREQVPAIFNYIQVFRSDAPVFWHKQNYN